jgi:peptidoglycan hydrolase-like protein with peptidoglycan-binding domain
MVPAEKARLACDALAKEDGARAHKQDEAAFRFSRTLSKGMAGPDVRELQRFLNGHGFVVSGEGDGSPGNETDAFGALTVEAVRRYQKAYAAEILDPEGLSSPSGIFGPSSVRKANRLLEERRQ